MIPTGLFTTLLHAKNTMMIETSMDDIPLIKQWEETEDCEDSGIDLMDYFKKLMDFLPLFLYIQPPLTNPTDRPPLKTDPTKV